MAKSTVAETFSVPFAREISRNEYYTRLYQAVTLTQCGGWNTVSRRVMYVHLKALGVSV